MTIEKAITAYFYAKDHGDTDQLIHAFSTKAARDGFVESGNRRFALTAAECDELCMKKIGMKARTAAERGHI